MEKRTREEQLALSLRDTEALTKSHLNTQPTIQDSPLTLKQIQGPRLQVWISPLLRGFGRVQNTA